MKSLELIAGVDTPTIVLNKERGVFEIAGKSLPNNPSQFYEPVMKWIKEYIAEPNPATVFSFKMKYFNTASSKIIMEIMDKLKQLHDSGKQLEIHWFYYSDDEEMLEAGEEYSEILEVPFVFKTM